MTKDSFVQGVQFIWIQGGSLPDKRIRTLNLLNQYEAEIEQSHKYFVMQAEGSDGAQGAAVASGAAGEANTCADWKVKCHKCGEGFEKVTDLWKHLDSPCV